MNSRPEASHINGIQWEYNYQPEINQTQVVIEIMDDAKLSPELHSLILKLREQSSLNLEALNTEEKGLFSEIIKDCPSLDVNRPITAKPSLNSNNIVIKIKSSGKNNFQSTVFPINNIEDFQKPLINMSYIKRFYLHKKIKDYFSRQDNKTIILTIHGLGGVGKTQLAQYVFLNSEEVCLNKRYQFKAWFYADNRNILMQQYLSFSEKFKIPIEDVSYKERAQKIKNWLEFKTNGLLVYDNVEKEEEIYDLLPLQSNYHHIIITSRNSHWPSGYSPIDVDVMELDEALQLIKQILSSEKKEEEKELKELVEGKLGCLPLAVTQAGNYIKRCKITVKKYLELYNNNQKNLLSLKESNKMVHEEFRKQPSAKGLSTSEKHEPVWITFDLNLKQLKERTQEAIELLFYCAYLQSDRIPDFLLCQIIQTQEIQNQNSAELKINECIDVLREYSIIRVIQEDNDSRIFTIHRLLQEIIRFKLKDFSEDLCNNSDKIWHHILHIGEALCQAYKIHHINMEKAQDLLPHFETLDNYLQQEEKKKKSPIVFFSKIADFYSQFGSALRNIGNFEFAKTIYKKVLELRQNTNIQKNEQAIAQTMASLGIIYRDLYELENSLELLNKAKNIQEKIGEEKNRDLGWILLNIGTIYRNMKRPDEAKKYYDRSLSILTNYYGRDNLDPEIGDVLRNLGCACRDLKDNKMAIDYFQKARKILEACYGKDHPKIARLNANITEVYINLEEMKEARNLILSSLMIQKNRYGDTHIETAKSKMYLGITYLKEDPVQARTLLEQALEIFNKKLPSDYGYIIKTKKLIDQVNNGVRLNSEVSALSSSALIFSELSSTGNSNEIKQENNSFQKIIISYAKWNIQLAEPQHLEDYFENYLGGTNINYNFDGIDLSNQKLNKIIVSRISFKKANFIGSSLKKADLSYCDLSHTNLTECKFNQSNLFKANLYSAILTRAKGLSGRLLSKAESLKYVQIHPDDLHNREFCKDALEIQRLIQEKEKKNLENEELRKELDKLSIKLKTVM